MKLLKKGFTLSEVLIIVGIIGVVAALSIPVLAHNISDASVFPKLSKFKTTFENASGLMLAERNLDSIMLINTVAGADDDGKAQELMNILQNYMKVSEINADNCRFGTDDGMCFQIEITGLNNNNENDILSGVPAYQKIGTVTLDINGAKGPNAEAQDRFLFIICNDGTLHPNGSGDNIFHCE